MPYKVSPFWRRDLRVCGVAYDVVVMRSAVDMADLSGVMEVVGFRVLSGGKLVVGK